MVINNVLKTRPVTEPKKLPFHDLGRTAVESDKTRIGKVTDRQFNLIFKTLVLMNPYAKL